MPILRDEVESIVFLKKKVPALRSEKQQRSSISGQYTNRPAVYDNRVGKRSRALVAQLDRATDF